MEKYICNICDYKSNKQIHYERHCNTIKHKKNIDKTVYNSYICEYCSKEYNKPNSLWYHVKKCKILYDEILNRKILEKQKMIKYKKLKKN